nr:NADH dehydrogenase subunit 2 [Cyphoderus sp.]
MFLKSYMYLFFTFLILGTIVSISANNWFTVWLGLEINLMSMIPIMINKINQPYTEAAIKYFITQAMASVLLVFSASLNLFMNNFINLEMINILMIISLLMKSGMAPFHFWFPQVIMNTNWTQSMLLFSWQKVAPLMLLASSMSMMILFTAVTSAVIGSVSGINQTLIKLMLTFSSISHSGWMVMACSLNFKLWLIYFLIYCFLIITIINLTSNKFNKINEMNYFNSSPFYKIMWVSTILSLGGMPPLLGFLSKMLVINKIIYYSLFFVTLMLIISSLISLFWYLRMIYSAIVLNHEIMKIQPLENKSMMSNIMITSTLMNISSPVIMLILT